LVELANLARRAFDDDIAQCDLAVASDGNLVAAADAQNGGCVKLFHGIFLLKCSHGDEGLVFKAGLAARKRAPKAPVDEEDVSRRRASAASRGALAPRETRWRWAGPAGGRCRWARRFPRTSRIRR